MPPDETTPSSARFVSASHQPWSATRSLLYLLVAERSAFAEQVFAADRAARRAERDARRIAAAVLGETAGDAFRARAVAIEMARAIASHRAAVAEPRDADRALWTAFDAAWEGIDHSWGVTPPLGQATRTTGPAGLQN